MDNNPPLSEAKPPYQFWAFISYSRKDEQQAKKLHEFIETFGVPVELVEHHTTPIGEAAPARLKPCFRDKDDLPSDSSVSKALREKLAASRFLVVVCSPNSAASIWVDKEIKEFRALHGEAAEDRIHAFIIAGIPNPDAIDCCFPPSLRDQDPCALNATALGEGDRIAKLKLIAAMLGVPPDAIIRRDQERRMKRMKLAVAVALLLVSVLSWFWWRASVARDAEEVAKNKAQAALIAANEAREAEKTAKERAINAEAKTAEQLKETTIQKQRAVAAEEKTAEQLKETQRQLERSWLEEGRAWLERGKVAFNKGDHLGALMLAGRAVGYQGYGRTAQETKDFNDAFPLLLGAPMKDPAAEKERAAEAQELTQFIDSIRPSYLPVWAVVAGEPVRSVAFSPDGTRLACGTGTLSADRENTIKFWDTATGKELARLHGHTDWVNSVAFNPDGTRLASSSADNTIKLWDTATGKEFTKLRGHTGSVNSVAFSPDGTRLASGSNDNTIKFWDAATGKELASLQGHTDSVNSVAFSPDGSRLASGSDDNTIKFWDAVTGKELARCQGHTHFVFSVAFSPDSTRLASGSRDNTIKLWDAATGKELASLQGHTSYVQSIAFSPDGTRLASGSNDNTIKLWDAATGKELTSLQGHTYSVLSVAFSPDGTRLVSGSWDKINSSGNTVKLWDAAIDKERTILRGHMDSVRSVAYNRDGTCLASGSRDNTIKLWDAATGKELVSLQGHTHYVNSLAFNPEGTRLASGSDDSTIKLWDGTTGKELANLRGHTGSVHSVTYKRDGTCLASGSSDKTIKLWDAATGKELANLEGHTGFVYRVAFSPDGTRLASGSKDSTIKLWDVAAGKELASLRGHASYVLGVAFSPDGTRLVSRSIDNTIKVWDAAAGIELEPASSDALATAEQWEATDRHHLSPDQRHIAKIYDKHVCIDPNPPTLNLAAPLRARLLTLPGREVQIPGITQPMPMLHVRQGTLAQLADPNLTSERRAELRMELCTKSSQFRAATALWQRLLQGDWPDFEGATVPKDHAPAAISADSPIRRLYLLALIDATKHPQIHGHPTICQTAAQIAPVLTKEMMATPTISLAMMSLMQTLAKDDSPDMSAPHTALLKRLEDVAAKEWLAVLREAK